ncbi:ankyrin repeat domain-containing protein [Chamaesiphon sp. VAR_48_metabat_403]|uniref:ankyrin repeat domain-containing protein n=1 Tax=Chamaesiphon sp. VAR_48_metabat_403 TaxID=2964700 RepID=UPI00286E8897|nr:ankyrin repeat domain-containing protein [Chamaesiphon sp. VAR_48_metabat_403]
MQYLHQQSPPLIHRDLKPHNIIRNDDGRVFLVDFGAVQDVYNHTLLKGSTVAGTFGYMAPEQFRGAAVPASDLYGLGATILYLLTHRSPADLPQERLKLNFRDRVNISDRFADWLETMLEPDLSARFTSTAAALTALQKPNWFRTQRSTQISFPWRGAAITAMILAIFVPLIYGYRYTFITRLGFPARDICDAIGSNDIKSVRKYLDRGVSVNATVVMNEAGMLGYRSVSFFQSGSLLHCAIDRGQIEVVKYLLDNGADIDSLSSNDGFTPLHQAIKMSCPIEGNQRKDCDRQLQILLYLLDRKANIKIESHNGSTPLMFAVAEQKASAVKYLLKYGADPHEQMDNKSSLWHLLAASEGEFNKTEIASIAKQLVLANVDINQADDRGNTPLHLASIRSNQVKTIGILLANGARTDLQNNLGETPLINAISRNYFEPVKLLLSKNSEINVPDRYGKTPLKVAIDAAARDGYGDTFTSANFTSSAVPPLDLNLASPKIIKLLLAKGANPNLVDRYGNTALHLLGNLDGVFQCQQKRSMAFYILDLFIQYRVNIQAVNEDGDTALHILAKRDFFPVTDRLIGYGGNPLQKNRHGKNALELIKAAPPRSSRCKADPDNTGVK